MKDKPINKLMRQWSDRSQSSSRSDIPYITLGYVVDTNDPQQMGRVRAACPALGDSLDADLVLEEVPWAQYSSPFAGVTPENSPRATSTEKGNTLNSTPPLTYGFWSPPKVGSQVLVMCIDGDPQYRAYIGCLFNQHTTHTLPHGRYSYNIPDNNSSTLDGPYTSSESPIQPLYDNLTNAFTSSNPLSDNGKESIEWITRGADYSAAAIDNQNLEGSFSTRPDDKDFGVELKDGAKFVKRQGYAYDRVNSPRPYASTGARFDNQVHSWTTPGFHAIAMDDRPENCRMRFRTTTGHQILLDDSNERIYISTAEGKNWIEMDQKGNIDIYSEQKISIHSESDVNINSSKNIRMSAKNIHLNASEQLRLYSAADISIKTDSNFRVNSTGSLFVQSAQAINLLSGSSILATSSSTLALQSPSIQASSTIQGAIQYAEGANQCNNANTAASPGPVINVSPPIVNPPSASPAESINANLTTRKPLHEPWPRLSYNLDLTDVSSAGEIPSQVLEHSVTSLKVNVEDHGVTYNRNPFWLR